MAGNQTWAKRVHSAVQSLLQVINAYRSSNIAFQVISSKMFNYRRKQLQTVVEKAVAILHVRKAWASG